MKVFGIGLNKTGTTTLGVCLETLGYSVKAGSLVLTRQVEKGALSPVFQVVDRYDAFQDWPWPLIYRDLDARYPGSKFILTVRADSETWYQSLVNHANRTGPTEYRHIAYGYEMPHHHKQQHIELYETHNDEVREYFRGRDSDFMEVCWEMGTGWEELCAFLKCDVPGGPVPHANKSLSRTEQLFEDGKRKVVELLRR